MKNSRWRLLHSLFRRTKNPVKKHKIYYPIVAVTYRKFAIGAAAALGLLAYYFILVDPQAVLDRTIFYAFQTRDMNRALRLMNGWPIFFGPEMTGGGNLPGPFYYILLIPGLFASGDWRGPWMQMMLLAGASSVLAWFFFRRRGMQLAGLLCVTLIPLSVITNHYMTLFINPSFLYVAVIPALILICEAFHPDREIKSRGRCFVGAALIISLGIQIHYSIIFLFFAMLFMHGFRKRFDLPKIENKYLWFGLITFAIPFTPYLIWSFASSLGRPFGQPSVYVGEVSDVWPTLLHLLSAVFEFDPLAALRRTLMQFVNNTPVVLPLAIAAVFLARGLRTQARAGLAEENSEIETRGKHLLKPLAVCAAFGFVPFSYIFFVPIANRYSLPMVIPLIFVAATVLESWLNSKLKLYCFNILAGGASAAAIIYLYFDNAPIVDPIRVLLTAFLGFMAVLLMYFKTDSLPAAKIIAFTLTALVGALHLQIYRTGALRSNENNMVRYDQWRTMWQKVYSRTGWPPEELKRRVYFVNTHTNGDPEPMYRTVMREQGAKSMRPDAPDGYIVIAKPPHEDLDIKEFLLGQAIAEDLKTGLRNGDVELMEPSLDQLWSVAYRVKPGSHLPKSFHNWGLYYNTSEHAELLNEHPGDRAYEAGGKYVFKWNECPDKHPYCNSAARVELERLNKNEVKVKVDVIGEALSQNSPWIHPTWTQSWNDPFVEIKCGKQPPQTLKLASSIGYRREYLVYEPVTLYFIGNNSILAPFERTFSIPCPESVSEISVGRASSSVDQVRGSLTLPGQKLSLKL